MVTTIDETIEVENGLIDVRITVTSEDGYWDNSGGNAPSFEWEHLIKRYYDFNGMLTTPFYINQLELHTKLQTIVDNYDYN